MCLAVAVFATVGRSTASVTRASPKAAERPTPRASELRWDEESAEATPSPPFEAACISVFAHGSCFAAPERSIAVVEARTESGWSGCAVLEATGGFNEAIRLRFDDALTIRGHELAARPRIHTYDVELAQMCASCLDDEDEPCDDVCAYESFATVETVLVSRDRRLAPRSRACLVR